MHIYLPENYFKISTVKKDIYNTSKCIQIVKEHVIGESKKNGLIWATSLRLETVRINKHIL